MSDSLDKSLLEEENVSKTEMAFNVKTEILVSTTTKTDIVKEEKHGVNIMRTLHSGFLLLGPFILGIAINCIGNEAPIRAHFAYLPNYTDQINEPDLFPSDLWSLGFLFPFGGFVGSIIASALVDRIGRKWTTLFLCFFVIVGAILKIISRYTHVALLFIGRFLDGVGAAGYMVSTVLLMLESMTTKVELIYKPLVQMCLKFGVLFMGIIGLNEASYITWNFIYIASIAFTCVLALVVVTHTESPKFIYTKHRDTKATEKIFRTLRGKHYSQLEVDKLKAFVKENLSIKPMGIWEFFTTKEYRGAIASVIFLHIGQQLSGINAVVAFAPSLLKSAGFQAGDTGGTIIFSMCVFGSMFFAPIIERKQRKLLWLTGFLFMSFCFTLLEICEYAEAPSGIQIFWLCLFVFMFQLGPGPVVWFISLEIFPPSAIGAAQGVCTSFNWLANTLVYLISPIAVTNIGIKFLFIFVAFQAAIMIYSVFFIVETFGKSSQQILDEYQAVYGIKRVKNINVTHQA